MKALLFREKVGKKLSAKLRFASTGLGAGSEKKAPGCSGDWEEDRRRTQKLSTFPLPIVESVPEPGAPSQDGTPGLFRRGRYLIGPLSITRPNSMVKARRAEGDKKALTSAQPGPSGPEREGRATQILPAGRVFLPKGPEKTAFWFLCRRGQRNPSPGRRNSPFAWVCLSERSERHERIAGGRRNRTGGQPPGPPCRLSPGPPLRGRFPEDRSVTPARVVTGLPPLPRRCRWPGKGEKAVRLDGESAPVATSRRCWSVFGGRRNAAPTQRAGAAL